MFLLSLLETKWYPILFDTPFNIVRSVCIWLTLAAVVVFLSCFFTFKGDNRKKFAKISGIAAVAYACVVGLVLLSLSYAEDGIQPIFFFPLLALIIAVVASTLILVFKRNKTIYAILGSLVGAAAIACLVCMCVYFASDDTEGIESVALYVSAAVLTVIVIAAAFLFDKNSNKGFSTRAITFAAVCIAMSFALSYLRIVKMPQGGSITIASLLPLMIYAYMFGTKRGVFAGLIYGVLQAFQDTYIVHPAQFLLDYPLAFSCIGLAGIFANAKALKYPQLRFACGAIVAGLGRFLMHFLSGIFAFGAGATIEPVWLFSLTYQASYVLPDIAIAIVAGILVFSSKTFVHEMERYAENFAPLAKPVAVSDNTLSDESSENSASKAE